MNTQTIDQFAPSTGTSPAPATMGTAERLGSLDLIRGVAILGILLANIPYYSQPSDLFGTRPGDGSVANRIVVALTLFLVDGKFITLLSMLFGAGLAIQAERAEQAERPFAGYYARRMGLLFLIGLAHWLLLWDGDILTSYAIVGLGALLLSCRSRRALLGGMAGSFGWAYAWLLLFLLPVAVVTEANPELRTAWLGPTAATEPGDSIAEELDRFFSHDNQVRTFQQGTFGEMVAQRAASLASYTIEFGLVIAWYLLGCFLLGILLLRRGVFHDPGAHRPFLYKLILWGLAFGVPCHVVGVVAYFWHPDGLLSWFCNGAGALAQALAYLGLLLLWSRSGRAAWLQRRLRAVGRMTLSNYLLQSLLCGFIFYSYGLRLFGRVGRVEALGVVLGIWLLEFLVSPWWLRHFQMGPVEWLWRSLAEGRRQLLLRRGHSGRHPASSG